MPDRWPPDQLPGQSNKPRVEFAANWWLQARLHNDIPLYGWQGHGMVRRLFAEYLGTAMLVAAVVLSLIHI